MTITDIVASGAIIFGILVVMVGIYLLLGRVHVHCWHEVPGEDGLEDQEHGRFIRTVRMEECCTCPARVPGEVIAEQWK